MRLLSKEHIRITSIVKEDKGMYQCLIKNDFESAQSSAELRLGGMYFYSKKCTLATCITIKYLILLCRSRTSAALQVHRTNYAARTNGFLKMQRQWEPYTKNRMAIGRISAS